MSDLSIVGVCAYAFPDQTAASGYRFRIALASVAPVPFIPLEAQQYVSENPLSQKSISRAADIAASACKPIDDVRGGAGYRKAMVRNLTIQALEEVRMKLNS